MANGFERVYIANGCLKGCVNEVSEWELHTCMYTYVHGWRMGINEWITINE